MITVELTECEYRLIRASLESEYYNAKECMDAPLAEAIISLETKLSKLEIPKEGD